MENKVYIVREIYGTVFGVYKNKEDAEDHVDKVYECFPTNSNPDFDDFMDVVVEEWGVE